MSEDQNQKSIEPTEPILRRTIVAVDFDIDEAMRHADARGQMPVMTLRIPPPARVVHSAVRMSAAPALIATPGQAMERRAIPVVFFEVDPTATPEEHHFVMADVRGTVESVRTPPRAVAFFPTPDGNGLGIYEVELPAVKAQNDAVQSDG